MFAPTEQAGAPGLYRIALPNCIDHVGCLTVFALPASPVSVAVAFEWASLDYDLARESLSGISVKPELSPPILVA